MAIPLLPLAGILTSKVFMAGLAGVLTLVLGFSFFLSDYLFILAIIGGAIYIITQGEVSQDNIIPIFAIAVMTPIAFQFFGVASLTPDVAASITGSGPQGAEDYPAIEADVSDKKVNAGLTDQMLAQTIAPRTYREIGVEVTNNDDIPLVTDGVVVMAWMGNCEDQGIKGTLDNYLSGVDNPCEFQQADTVTLNDNYATNFYEFTKQVADRNHVGATAQDPEETNFWEDLGNTWQDTYAINKMDPQGEMILWDPAKCEEMARDSVDCSNAQKTWKQEEVAYVWADDGVETPSSWTLNVALLEPTDNSIFQDAANLLDSGIETVTLGRISGILDSQNYRVVALQNHTINVATPNTQLLVLFGGLGLLASILTALRVPPFDQVAALAA